MIPEFLYPFLAYRSLLMPFLVLSAITVPCWVAFRLYRLRTHVHRLSFQREILLLTFVVYLSGLAAVTLIPNHSPRLRAEAPVGFNLRPDLASLTCSSAALPTGSTARAFCVRNARGNVMLFFPLGILLPLVWRIRLRRGIVIAIAASVSIELVQYLSSAWSYRAADINDVVLNVFGASLGLVLVSLLRLRNGSLPAIARA